MRNANFLQHWRCPLRKELQYCRKYCSIAGSNGSNGSNGSGNGSNGCNGNCGNERKPKRMKEVTATQTFFCKNRQLRLKDPLCAALERRNGFPAALAALVVAVMAVMAAMAGINGSNGRNGYSFQGISNILLHKN